MLAKGQDRWLLTSVPSNLLCVPGTCTHQTVLTLPAKDALRQRGAFSKLTPLYTVDTHCLRHSGIQDPIPFPLLLSAITSQLKAMSQKSVNPPGQVSLSLKCYWEIEGVHELDLCTAPRPSAGSHVPGRLQVRCLQMMISWVEPTHCGSSFPYWVFFNEVLNSLQSSVLFELKYSEVQHVAGASACFDVQHFLGKSSRGSCLRGRRVKGHALCPLGSSAPTAVTSVTL